MSDVQNKNMSAAAQEAVAWPNECSRTVPEALRFLANHERPSGGEDRFNSLHLIQLASEIERMASKPLYAAPVTAALGIDLAALRARVVSAIERITSGTGQMRVPADLTDPDLVLADVLTLLDALDPHCTDSPKGGSEARALLDALVSLVAVARRYLPDYDEHPEVQKADDAIDAAMQAQAGDAAVQP